jgi:hypothetical protein
MSNSHPYYNAGSSPSIPIVQGQFVSSPGTTQSYDHHNDAVLPPGNYHQQQQSSSQNEFTHGEKQPNNCKDVLWAILFYAHLGVMAFATIYYAPIMAQDVAADLAGGAYRRLAGIASSASRYLEEDEQAQGNAEEAQVEDATVDFDLDMTTIVVILAIAGLAGLVISTGAMSLMMIFPRALIKASLFFNLICMGTMAILAIVSGAIPVAFMAGIMFVVNLWYTFAVWSRIPFAAANLVTAISAVKSNMGLTFFAYNNLLVTFLWSIWWSIGFVAASYVISQCNPEGYCEGEMNGFLVFLFLVSFFWTAQVIKNVVHVTTAGTVATWWLFPLEASGCCSSAVRESYWRSVTTSFGSICLGSLIVALIQATREIVNSLRQQDDSLILCIADCLLGCLESLAEYFNKWAYIYVGIYGYSFVEASVNVMSLFRNRGWSAIIADVLVDTVLLMVSACVGVVTGIIGVIVASIMQQGGATMAGSFFVGMLIGFVFCSTLFGLISSGVNAVIVLFAESPAEFQANHPELSQEMLAAYRSAYPGEFRY